MTGIIDSYRPIDPFNQHYELYEEEDDINYEKIVQQIAQMLIEYSAEMKELSSDLANKTRSFWMDSVRDHAALYDWTRLPVTFVPLAKAALEILTISTLHKNLDLQNNAAFKEMEGFSKLAELAKQFLDTRDQGFKTQYQAFSELAKSSYEYNLNDVKNSDAQIQEALRKIYDFIRETEGQKQGLARG